MSTSRKYFRFNPAAYNATMRMVKNVHLGTTVPMADGDVMIDYLHENEIQLFFFRLQLHTPTPDDIDPPADPIEIRQAKRTIQARVIIFAVQVVAVMALIAYFVFFNN